ncbi:hypothetical protein MtrunA17_Chr3g0133711 [Medicago truncatula]|uniref:Uncharacterized protein n=1 Tax=Medicago truncatula TaxID=3880 RepID=A0A396IX32_MEDTR|nr:hypothetical protein MtrunA17_Chr3g0133711 [Medicago truncatula]
MRIDAGRNDGNAGISFDGSVFVYTKVGRNFIDLWMGWIHFGGKKKKKRERFRSE